MYEKLVSLIRKDFSLSVRKTALDTFAFWACLEDGSKDDCRSEFVSNNIFNFDIDAERWRKEIIENFNKTLGLDIENR